MSRGWQILHLFRHTRSIYGSMDIRSYADCHKQVPPYTLSLQHLRFRCRTHGEVTHIGRTSSGDSRSSSSSVTVSQRLTSTPRGAAAKKKLAVGAKSGPSLAAALYATWCMPGGSILTPRNLGPTTKIWGSDTGNQNGADIWMVVEERVEQLGLFRGREERTLGWYCGPSKFGSRRRNIEGGIASGIVIGIA